MYTSGITHVVLPEKSKYKNLFKKWEVSEVFDRRSAAYFAVGMSQELNNPVLLFIEEMNDASLSNALPGITEAYYQNVPLVVMGTTFGCSWLQDANRVIGDKCVYACAVCGESDGISKKDIITLNKARLSLTENGGGPVYINYIDRGCDDVTCDIPMIHVITEAKLITYLSEIKNTLRSTSIHLLLDATEKYTEEDIMYLSAFCSEFNAHISSADVYLLTKYLPIRDYDKKDMLIEFGTTHTYTYGQAVGNHWIVDPGLDIHDILDLFIRVRWRDFLRLVVSVKSPTISLKAKEINLDDSWETKSIISCIVNLISAKTWVSGFMIYGENISGALTDNPMVDSASFVDVSGKDGKLSVFIGQSIAAKDDMCLCFIDHTDFFRDMNALHIQSIKENAKIVLFSNASDAEKAIDWADSCGFDTIKAVNMEELKTILPYFLKKGNEKPSLLVILYE